MLAPGTAETLKKAGQAAAAASADASCENWTAKAIEYVKAYPFAEFMTEEVRLWAADSGLSAPPDSRAWGAVMKRACQLGIVRRIEYRPTRGAEGHGKLGSVWTKNPDAPVPPQGVQAIELQRGREAVQVAQALVEYMAGAPACFKPAPALAAILARAQTVVSSSLPLPGTLRVYSRSDVADGNYTLSNLAKHVEECVSRQRMAKEYAAFILRELFVGEDRATLDRLLPGWGLLKASAG